MVDEFIYQFQSFAQYRGKLAQKSPHELELLKKCDGVWDLQGVLHYLQGLIDKSGVVRELASDGQCLFCSTSCGLDPFPFDFCLLLAWGLLIVIFQYREVLNQFCWMCSVAGNLPNRRILRGRIHADLLPTGMILKQYEQHVLKK